MTEDGGQQGEKAGIPRGGEIVLALGGLVAGNGI